MALQKQNLNIPLGKGMDTKMDPFQIPIGKMRALQNIVFEEGNLFRKRNGYAQLTAIDDETVNTLTTFNGALTAIGANLYNYAPETAQWYNKGPIASIQLGVSSLVRSATSQSQQDVAVSSLGLACAVWLDSDGTCKYQIIDTESSQVVIAATNLPSTTSNPRAFVLGNYFIIMFMVTVSATTHLRYISIPLNNPSSPSSATDLATNPDALTSGFDGAVINGNLYFAWSASGPDVKLSYLDRTLTQHGVTTLTGKTAKYVSITGDTSTPTPTIWLTYYDNTDSNLYAASFSSSGVAILASTVLVNSSTINNVTSTAANGVLTAYYQSEATYSFSSVRTDFITKVACTAPGVVGSPAVIIRSVALASKAFILEDTSYMMVAYGGAFQPTYFVCDSSGNIVAKLAYSDGGGYPGSFVLAGANVDGSSVQIGYLFKDLLTAVNKTAGVANTAGIYSQTGINLATFTLNDQPMVSAEIGSNLHLAGGFVWLYDGAKPVEHGFHVWPEDIGVSTTTGAGGLTAQQYYYKVVYEWTDAQGNIHRSAPSIPVGQVTTTASSTNTIKVPTLRLTYKTTNKVRIVIYRWSTAQQNYYQITSVTSPLLNDPSADSVSYADAAADSAILGNQLIYTTGGVIENIAAPACTDISLFKSRAFVIDAEDENVLWYSKQVIQSTPVEFSDLFTLYLAPTIGAQGSTGKTRVIASMDDKNIFFKANAIYYNTGNGPDNTGANNDFSDPVFITSTVGCVNPQSVVLMPQGIMFQSNGKGIWLLGRDLSTTYIGAPVDLYFDVPVLSAFNVPGTNQVRFTLSNGVTLMYDYYYGEWGTFTNVPAIASTIFQGLHCYINSNGKVYQETPGLYLDGSSPVLMSFTTGWINLAGLQGFERAYFFYFLGSYISPHKLSVGVAFDYNPSPTQNSLFCPDNYSPNYGDDAGFYGSGSPYGGPSSVEQFRVFLQQQKCQAFQITVSEVFDPSYGTVAGAGLSMSGLNMVVGMKKGYPTLKASRSVG
jgi:hypothetical protein